MKHRNMQSPSRSIWSEHLAEAEKHVVAAKKQVRRQREVIAGLADAGCENEVAAWLLNAMEDSLRAFERHRQLILDRLKDAG